jgi:restriction endonuclease Mrr
MPVPSYDAFMLPLLRTLADGQEHENQDLRDRLAAEFKLSDADRAELSSNGRQAVFDNRVGWAKTYLDKAGLLTSPRRVKANVPRVVDDNAMRARVLRGDVHCVLRREERWRRTAVFREAGRRQDQQAARNDLMGLRTPLSLVGYVQPRGFHTEGRCGRAMPSG